MKRIQNRSFYATDNNGNRHRILEATPILDSGTFGDPDDETPDFPQFFLLPNMQRLQKIGDELKNLATGERLRIKE